MALIPKFNMNQVEGYMKKQQGVIEQAIIQNLLYVGEDFVKNARVSGDYTDHTGNLRSSIGFVIIQDGKQLFNSGFPLSEIGTDRVTGQKTGRQVIKEMSEKFPKGIVLIVTAGMEYAAAVESYNKDVLTASSITAEADLIEKFTRLKTKLGK